MRIHFIRHATMLISLAGLKLLVDPMLSPAEAMDPVQNAANSRRIPLVDLPFTAPLLDDLLKQVDAVLVTHTHRDHWDAEAIAMLPKTLPVFCQPPDETRLNEAGFLTVLPVETGREWRGVSFTRTGGQHGTGEIGQRMGPVSGFVLRTAGEPSLYIAGDTIWCPEVDLALRQHRPDITVVNAGAAQFLAGSPITMTAADVGQVCTALPATQVVAVHMEAVNHCLLTRAELSQELVRAGLQDRVKIPADGELLEW